MMLINTLADNKYDEYPYWLVIASTLLSLSILRFDFLKKERVHATREAAA